MKDALIWGASGGMGRALTQQLIDAGWRVFAAARDTSRIPSGVHEAYNFEAANHAALMDIAIDLAHQTDGLALSVYFAGELRAELLKKMTPEQWAQTIDSNFTGAFMTTSQTLHLHNPGAHLVYIGAYIDHLILPKMGAYAAAKAGLETLVDVLQKENRKLNFTLVKPGAVDTPFWENAPFRLPTNAKTTDVVAQAIMERINSDERGPLEL